jgi:hypothetical protein
VNVPSMTKGQLLAAIASLPDDAPVILASDEEGNGYGFAYDVTVTGRCAVLWPAGDRDGRAMLLAQGR